MTITTIGLDLAKSVFQAHGVDENGAKVLVKTAAPQADAAVLLKAVTMPHRRRSLRNGALLGAYACRDGDTRFGSFRHPT